MFSPYLKDHLMSRTFAARCVFISTCCCTSGISQEELQDSSTSIQENDIISSYNHATDAFLSMLLVSESKSSLTRIQSQTSFYNDDLYGCVGQPLEIAFHRLIQLTVKQGWVFGTVKFAVWKKLRFWYGYTGTYPEQLYSFVL
jgi:hypothetical protein